MIRTVSFFFLHSFSPAIVSVVTVSINYSSGSNSPYTLLPFNFRPAAYSFRTKQKEDRTCCRPGLFRSFSFCFLRGLRWDGSFVSRRFVPHNWVSMCIGRVIGNRVGAALSSPLALGFWLKRSIACENEKKSRRSSGIHYKKFAVADVAFVTEFEHKHFFRANTQIHNIVFNERAPKECPSLCLLLCIRMLILKSYPILR